MTLGFLCLFLRRNDIKCKITPVCMSRNKCQKLMIFLFFRYLFATSRKIANVYVVITTLNNKRCKNVGGASETNNPHNVLMYKATECRATLIDGARV